MVLTCGPLPPERVYSEPLLTYTHPVVVHNP